MSYTNNIIYPVDIKVNLLYNSNRLLRGITYDYFDSVLNISGGKISGNIATDNGGGIYYDCAPPYLPQTITGLLKNVIVHYT